MEGIDVKATCAIFVNFSEFSKHRQCGGRKFWHLERCCSAQLKKKTKKGNVKCCAEYI